MNLFFRFFWTLFISRFRSKVPVMGPCVTPYHCWPTDLDLYRHMNNGVYFSLQDCARTDLVIRSGMADIVKKHHWYPVLASETIRFRQSLLPFQKFTIRTQVAGWDERFLIIEHAFMRGSEVAALGMVKVRFLKRSGGGVTIPELLTAVGHDYQKNPLAENSWAAQWCAAEDNHWNARSTFLGAAKV